MSFSLEPLDTDLTFLVEHHLIERIIELHADHAKGTPIFIEPNIRVNETFERL